MTGYELPNPFADEPAGYVPPKPKTAPGLVWLFGEEGVSEISFDPTDDLKRDQQMLRDAQRLFPEVDVFETPTF